MGNYITFNIDNGNNGKKIVLTFNIIHNENILYFDNNKYVKDVENPYIFVSVNLITTIGNKAFANCISLTKVIIPNSVTSIGYDAFYNCTSLTKIVIPESVTTIEYGVFVDCCSLTKVIIPNSVTTIGDTAFRYCRSLTKVIIPNSVTTIGDCVFAHCRSLTTVETNDANAYIIAYCKRYYPNIDVIINNEPYVLK